MYLRAACLAALLLAIVAGSLQACSYCNPNFQQRLTLRQNAKLAKFVVFGQLANARLVGDKGATDFTIDQVVMPHESLGKTATLTIPTFVPFNAKEPPVYLLFAEFVNGKLDVTHSRAVKTKAAADYLKGALAIDDRDRVAVLRYCFAHLDSAEPEVAEDAFHEFAKASDPEINQVAGKLAPGKLRALLSDPATPPERLGIFAYLLGACGTKDDAALLSKLIANLDERTATARSGLLGGLIAISPEQGWAAVQSILRTPERPFAEKLAALSTVRFYQAARADVNRKQIIAALASVLALGDMADMAIEDLRRWQWWELTPTVLAQYGKPTHAAPLMKRAIVRYALCCPQPVAAEFVKARRLAEPQLVETVEESLEFEKPLPTKQAP